MKQFAIRTTIAMITMIASLLTAFAFKSNHRSEASLRLLLPYRADYTVFVNRVAYHSLTDRMAFDLLRPGHQDIKILENFRSRRGKIISNRLLYTGRIFIPVNSKVWVKLLPGGRIVVDRTWHRNDRGGYYNNDRNQRRNGSGYRGGSLQYDSYYDEDWYGFNDSGKDRNGISNNRQNREVALANVLSAIRKQRFDTDRLKMAKNAVAEYGYQSEEIKQMAAIFSFDSYKLELLKFAYEFVEDPHNYVVVNSVLQFRSSVAELQDHIAHLQGR